MSNPCLLNVPLNIDNNIQLNTPMIQIQIVLQKKIILGDLNN